MPLAAWAVVDEAEFQRYADFGTADADRLIDALEEATRVLEEELLGGRELVTRGTLTELYSPEPGETDLYLNQWPVLAAPSITVHESSSEVWDASTLVDSSLYTVSSTDAGAVLIRKASSGGLTGWLSGRRTVRVVYAAGYANTAAVPRHFKDFVKRYAGLLYKTGERREWGRSSISDDRGNFTRFHAVGPSEQDRRAMRPHRRVELYPFGERDGAPA